MNNYDSYCFSFFFYISILSDSIPFFLFLLKWKFSFVQIKRTRWTYKYTITKSKLIRFVLPFRRQTEGIYIKMCRIQITNTTITNTLYWIVECACAETDKKRAVSSGRVRPTRMSNISPVSLYSCWHTLAVILTFTSILTLPPKFTNLQTVFQNETRYIELITNFFWSVITLLFFRMNELMLFSVHSILMY